MSINLKFLPPIVWGADYARLIQGVGVGGVVPTPANPEPFLSTDSLTATVSPGQELPSIFSPTVAWIVPSLAQFSLSISGTQSAMLAIDTQYLVEVFASRGGERFPLMAGYLPVLPAAGSQASSVPPDLVSLPYTAQLLAKLSLNGPQLEAIPTLLTGASNAIRSFCNRMFIRQTWTQIVPVELNGEVRLSQPPINQVLRVQEMPESAITITNATATTAWTTAQTSGGLYLGGSGLNSLTTTGLVLNWQLNGITSTQAIPFTTGMTIAGLAAAINAFGDGWTATADPVLGLWPVGEMFDTYSGKGAGPNDLPDGGASYHVFSSNVTDHRPDPDGGQETGIWWVGRVNGDGIDGRWGPDAWSWGGPNTPTTGKVRVTYDGGPQIVPFEVQSITVELVKAQLERLSTNLLLKSEHAADYSYEIALELLNAFPPQVLQTLARYRISNG